MKERSSTHVLGSSANPYPPWALANTEPQGGGGGMVGWWGGDKGNGSVSRIRRLGHCRRHLRHGIGAHKPVWDACEFHANFPSAAESRIYDPIPQALVGDEWVYD